jgi:hypothetical protein
MRKVEWPIQVMRGSVEGSARAAAGGTSVGDSPFLLSLPIRSQVHLNMPLAPRGVEPGHGLKNFFPEE